MKTNEVSLPDGGVVFGKELKEYISRTGASDETKEHFNIMPSFAPTYLDERAEIFVSCLERIKKQLRGKEVEDFFRAHPNKKKLIDSNEKAANVFYHMIELKVEAEFEKMKEFSMRPLKIKAARVAMEKMNRSGGTTRLLASQEGIRFD